MRLARWLAVMGTLVTVATPVAAQDVLTSGQVRSRHEIRDTDAAGTDGFTSMRVRAALEAVLDQNLTVFVQLQAGHLGGVGHHDFNRPLVK